MTDTPFGSPADNPADNPVERVCRHAAAAVAAGFTTYVVASWEHLDATQPEMAFEAVAMWVALAGQHLVERRQRRG